MSPKAVIQWMESLKGEDSIKQACEWLGIARSSYYRWKNQRKSQQTANPIVTRIRELCMAHKFRYGYRKITALLCQEIQVNYKRVQRMMRKEGLQCRVKVKKRKGNGQPHQVADHLLKRNFYAEKLLQKLVTDITYLPLKCCIYRASWTCTMLSTSHTVLGTNKIRFW